MIWIVLLHFGLLTTVLTAEFCGNSILKHLPNEAFTSSSSYEVEEDEKRYGPARAKITSTVEEFQDGTPMTAGWIAATVNLNQWLQIDLQQASVVKEIVTAGRDIDTRTGCCDQWVSSYLLQYSTDNINWLTANCTKTSQIFTGNNDTGSFVRNPLSCPVIARFLRILPRSWHDNIAMRVDILGCHISDESSKTVTENSPVYPWTLTRNNNRHGGSSTADDHLNSKLETWTNDNNRGSLNSDLLNFQTAYPHLIGIPPNQGSDGRSVSFNGDKPVTPSGNNFYWTSTRSTFDINRQQNSNDNNQQEWHWKATAFPRVVPTAPTNNHQRYTRSTTAKYPWEARDSGTRSNTRYPIRTRVISDTDTYVPQGIRIYGPTEYIPRGFIPKEYINGNPSDVQRYDNSQNPANGNSWNQPNGNSWNQQNGNSWNQPNSNSQNTEDASPWNPPNASPWNPPNANPWNPPNASPWIPPNANPWNPPNVNPQKPWNPSGVITYQEGVIAPKANDRCIESCYDRADGDYQSCRSCSVYVSCSNGNTFDNRECPGGLVWNDDQKYCDWTSSTCP
ncbi:lactadherin [Patella vulgata]|uniref:lactadherin n=1 Tax=Patella vulgata TaxID=6465 RepID=UPI0021802134|nr:lactadherin [Patella vulgata]